MKISVLLASAAVLFSASHAMAEEVYLFGFSPFGSSTLDTDKGGNINAFTHGWFEDNGVHVAGNNNYIVGSTAGHEYRDYFSFDSLLGVTSASVTIGNDPTTGLSLGSHSSVTWTLYDLGTDINTNQNYTDTGIFNDLGTGVVYGSVTVFGPTDHVTVNLNSAGIAALNRAGDSGSEFNFGGALSFGGAVPEPATWALMLGGFGLAGVALRRRRIAAA